MKLKDLMSYESVDENVEYRIIHKENIELDSHLGKLFCIFLEFLNVRLAFTHLLHSMYLHETHVCMSIAVLFKIAPN